MLLLVRIKKLTLQFIIELTFLREKIISTSI